MPQWATFAGFAIVVTAGLLLLSHASRGVLDDDPQSGERGSLRPKSDDTAVAERDDEERVSSGGKSRDDAAVAGDSAVDRTATRDPAAPDRHPSGRERGREETVVLPRSGVELQVTDVRSGGVEAGSAEGPRPRSGLSTASLLANVAVSQGLFGVLLLAGAWYAEIPAGAFGVAAETTTLGAVALGAGLGLVLYAANEAGATLGARFGLGEGERLRSALAPDSALGWAALLFVVLPVIAGFEELLFRGALVGALAAGYDVSPWLLALASSVAFGFGHGAQGWLGVLVTGALGFVLAAAFVATGSLLVVVVAHYLVNALEFVVHEGLGVEWPRDAV